MKICARLEISSKIEFSKGTIYFPIAVSYFLLKWKHISKFTYSIFDETSPFPVSILRNKRLEKQIEPWTSKHL